MKMVLLAVLFVVTLGDIVVLRVRWAQSSNQLVDVVATEC